jgi:hypothetical protein
MAYATTDDIAALIGRDLDEGEETRAEAVISLVSLAADAVVPNIDPDAVPAAVRAVVTSAALRRWLNPAGVMQEGVGGYNASHPQAGMLLTDAELSVLRRARTGLGTMRTPAVNAED